jgi:hypothetical protein
MLLPSAEVAAVEQVVIAASVCAFFDQLVNSSEGKLIVNSTGSTACAVNEEPSHQRILAE